MVATAFLSWWKQAVAKVFFGVFDRPGRAQRAVFDHIAQGDTKLAAVAEVAFNRLGEVTLRQDYFLDAVAGQTADDMLQEGPVEHRHHRLGRVDG